MPVNSPRKRLRVLIVEDNADGAASLQLLLSLWGYDVRVALSGTAGVQMAKAWAPNVVLCDIGLPGLSGFQVAAELRKDAATARSRLIAVTAYGDPETRRRARASGFDHVLVKPADFTALHGLLRAAPP